jgi:predicted lipase
MMDAILCNVSQPLQSRDGKVAPEVSPTYDDEESLSPFLAYEDGYKWPDLFTEVDEMMETCVLIYPLAELRRMVREGELQDESGTILKTPLTHTQILSIVESKKDELVKTQFGNEFYLDVLKTAEERNMMGISNTEEETQPVNVSPSTIVAFDDEFEQEELVYAIDVNHARKRVTVCFRGSVTKTDWATDFEIYMKDVPNPVKSHKLQKPTIKLHNGFYNYLFKPSSRGAKGPKGEPLSEYQEILQEHVLPVLSEHPGYKLYVTGHSLGAALATLFAFQVATEPDSKIPKPVSLFSIAGPYCGDVSFRAAHQLLEGLGKLRHLRLSNHKDLVTIVPKASFHWNIFDGSAHAGSLFKHAGVNLRLFEGAKSFEISYPRVRTGYFSSTYDELTRGFDQSIFANFSWNPSSYWKWPFHSLREYNKRLDANKPSLEALYVNDLYSRKDIVGNLIAQF